MFKYIATIRNRGSFGIRLQYMQFQVIPDSWFFVADIADSLK